MVKSARFKPQSATDRLHGRRWRLAQYLFKYPLSLFTLLLSRFFATRRHHTANIREMASDIILALISDSLSHLAQRRYWYFLQCGFKDVALLLRPPVLKLRTAPGQFPAEFRAVAFKLPGINSRTHGNRQQRWRRFFK